MDKKKFIISGTGCALADYLYTNVSFSSAAFEKYCSRQPGDGGLCPGKLVFTEELESFAGIPYPQILEELTTGSAAVSFNIGGPSLVSLIHASQMLDDNDFEVGFYGISGKDNTSEKIRTLLKKTPVQFEGYLEKSLLPTPFTHVLSDPDYHAGHGERTFVNNIGAAWDLTSEALPESFFSAGIVCFGGTAITPNLHNKLHELLKKAKDNGAITLVNTVYDFQNEKQNPGQPWPLGETGLSFPNIDILIMDNEEALKISGCQNTDDAFQFFRQHVQAFVITRGSEPVLYYAGGNLFEAESGSMAVSHDVVLKIENKQYRGDTTGCGDNFTGGIIAAIAIQAKQGRRFMNLKEAVVFGICSGGFTCSYHGGTYFEKSKGEKKQQVLKLIDAYHRQ